MKPVEICFSKSKKEADTSLLTREVAKRVQKFHQSFPQYAPTTLHTLPKLANHLNLGSILIKDESHRFDLNAFKVLGGSYAVAKVISEKLGKKIEEMNFAELCSPATLQQTGTITFSTTTDGNHGRGVAWTAKKFGHKAVVTMPKGSDLTRRDAIRALGAKCEISELNYDDCVRKSYKEAEESGWVTVQDTAWSGYEEIPLAIMQGYSTLALEALKQMQAMGVEKPTHIFLQAGVGSFAGAILGFFSELFKESPPTFIIVEPHEANCFYLSATVNDGLPHAVGGEQNTLMAGLACGEPNSICWEMLRDYPSAYVSCADTIAANGMRILGAPLKGDPTIVSGESGAVTTGLLHWLMSRDDCKKDREQLGLDQNSIVLCISTEGDTSPEIYRDVLWHGRNSL